MTSNLYNEINLAINMHSAENASNTPDFILAEFLVACLAAFDAGVWARSNWYGRTDAPGHPNVAEAIKGALFDFGGYLTTRKEAITLSSGHDAVPMVEALTAFLKERGFDPDWNAEVRGWEQRIGLTPHLRPEQKGEQDEVHR